MFVISNLCLVFGFGGSNGQVRIAIFALRTSYKGKIREIKIKDKMILTLGICGCENVLSTTTPFTNTVSSNRPPTFPCTLINSKFTSRRSISATFIIALTAISAI